MQRCGSRFRFFLISHSKEQAVSYICCLCTINNRNKELCSGPLPNHTNRASCISAPHAHIHAVDIAIKIFLINLQDLFCRPGLSLQAAPRMGLKHKREKLKQKEKKGFLVSFSQSKFSHFSNKKLMSCWNNTLLSAGIGWNFRSVSLLLGHIQPVAIENTASKGCFVLRGDSANGWHWCSTHPVYLYPSSLVYKCQPSIVSSLTAPLLPLRLTCPARCCSDGKRQTDAANR